MSNTDLSSKERNVTEFDGLIFIGKIVAVNPVIRTKDGEVIQGMNKIVMEGSRGEYTFDLLDVIQTSIGNHRNQEFAALSEGVGQSWTLSLGIAKSGTFVNYVVLGGEYNGEAA